MLLFVGASLWGNLLTGKGVTTAGEGTVWSGQMLILPDLSTNLQIQNHYQYEFKFNLAYSRNN